MYKVDLYLFFFFLSAIAKNFFYTEISEIQKKNYPNLKAFLVPAIKNVCKENGLPSRFPQSDVNEMVRAAVEEV